MRKTNEETGKQSPIMTGNIPGERMRYEVTEVGMLGVNCGILLAENDGGALVIDPGGDFARIVRKLGGQKPAGILLTHCHYDHIGAVRELLERFPECGLYCHKDCAAGLRDPGMNLSALITGVPYDAGREPQLLPGQGRVDIAGFEVEIFHVPGHSPGQLCYHFPEGGVVFCGDTVFAGGIGRSDLPGGDGELLRRKCIQMLEALPAQTELIPGHGPRTTAGYELENNPFL